MRLNYKSIFFISFVVAVELGCSAKILKKDNSDQLLKSEEYEKAVQVSNVQDPAGKYVKLTPEEYSSLYAKKSKAKLIRRKIVKTKATEKSSETNPAIHQPSIEDAEGFVGRRPIVDPFRPGEKMTFEVSYFGVVAGQLTMQVMPFVFVNGHKSYHFQASGRTSSVFEVFYAVDDWLETFVDYENMVPSNYAIHVKESKQLRETRSVFNWQTLKANYWDKRITKEDGVEEKKYDWDILPYSQNVFSAPFYLRTFKLETGKKLVYRVAHEKENILVTAEVLRREKLHTEAGDFNAVVLKPHIEIDGAFKPIGDIFLWLSDDDRHFILRIESKIKIGTLVAEIKALNKGGAETASPDPTPSPAPTSAQ